MGKDFEAYKKGLSKQTHKWKELQAEGTLNKVSLACFRNVSEKSRVTGVEKASGKITMVRQGENEGLEHKRHCVQNPEKYSSYKS